MPVNLKFYSTKELRPPHGVHIIYIESRASFGMIGFEPGESVVDYCWFTLDEEGDLAGGQISYDPGGPEPENCVLEVMFGNQVVTDRDDVWWTLAEEYFAAFEGEEQEGDAVPDLLAACELLLESQRKADAGEYGAFGAYVDAVELARMAVKKAKGGV